ncbi:Uncharacterised protein [Vibrio cholerae]|nr:Uncharacterised protein [Vibrio cholerae]
MMIINEILQVVGMVLIAKGVSLKSKSCIGIYNI